MNHGQAVEADLLARGVDLRDFYHPDGDLTARRLWVLIEHWCLPRGSATRYSMHGERGRWTVTDELVASLAGAKPPEDKAVTQWRAEQAARIQRRREAHRG